MVEPVVELEEPAAFASVHQCASALESTEDTLSIAAALRSPDPLVLQLDHALRGYLEAQGSKLSAALEMKHILLLFVKLFHELSERLEYRHEKWISELRNTIGKSEEETGIVRKHVGGIVVHHFEAAPWGLGKQSGKSRCNTVHTILASYAGIARFLRSLSTEIDRLATEGVDLKHWDVEEMSSDLEEEDEKDSVIPANKVGFKPGRKPGVAHGNHASDPPYIRWTNAEVVSLLETLRDNPTATNPQISKMHNHSFWGREVRSSTAARQELKKQFGGGRKAALRGRLQGKIDELCDKHE